MRVSVARRVLCFLLLASISGITASAAWAQSTVPRPEVSKAVHGGKYGIPFDAMPTSLRKKFGYTEREYFVSGEASSFTPTGTLDADGNWTVTDGSTAPFTTRVVVRRPTDPDKFNGTFVVEWLNVTIGHDLDVEFGALYPLLLQQGYGYIGVSAQSAGVQAGGALLSVPGVPEVSVPPLKDWDPERYGALEHPGDDYSFDIFQQAARGGIEASGLKAKRLIAVGESQSAGRLATYVNAIQPLSGFFDGFMLQGRTAGAAPIVSTSAAGVPSAVRIRTDLDARVLQIAGETDLEANKFVSARQPDTAAVQTWEIAGAAHSDLTGFEYAEAELGIWFDGELTDLEGLCGPVNDGPLAEVMRAGLTALEERVSGGSAPAKAQPITTAADGVIVRDTYGNAEGGVRTPAVDAPTFALSGRASPNNIVCSLFGSRIPLTHDQLSMLYRDHNAYVDAVKQSAQTAVRKGFLLRADASDLVREARKANVP